MTESATNDDSMESAMIPTHVAVIMDGNGRWAEARALPRHAGHRSGVKAVRETVENGGQARRFPPYAVCVQQRKLEATGGRSQPPDGSFSGSAATRSG